MRLWIIAVAGIVLAGSAYVVWDRAGSDTEMQDFDIGLIDFSGGLDRRYIVSADETGADLSGLPTDDWITYLIINGLGEEPVAFDLSQLQSMPGLTRLSLINVTGTDLRPIAELENLEFLGMSGVVADALPDLSGLPNLTRLGFGGIEVPSLAPVGDAERLTAFALAGPVPGDLSFLEGLTELRRLDLSGLDGGVSGDMLAPLAQARSLKELLVMVASPGIDLSPIDVSQLSRLELTTEFDDPRPDVAVSFAPLSEAVGLEAVYTLGIDVTEFEALGAISNVQSVHMVLGSIDAGLGALDGRPRIQTLSFADVDGVSDLSDLTNLPQLSSLHLSDVDVTDIDPIAAFAGLRHLALYGLDLETIAALEGLNLETLSLSQTVVPDLRPIARMRTLTSLNLSGYGMEALSVVASLPNLEELGPPGASDTFLRSRSEIGVFLEANP